MGRAGPRARLALGGLSLPDGAPPDPCGLLTPEELARLRQAAEILASQGTMVPRVGAWLGGQAERVVGLLGEGWRGRVQGMVEEALWRAQGIAMLGLDTSESHPRSVARSWLARVATTASGAATGFVGLPGVAIDIPFSTLTILRSIAEIARAEGEDISTDEGRRACLEVLALGAPSDEEAELGYWTARLGLAALNFSSIVPQAARMLGAALSEKLLAQAVPVAGAVAGASLNYMFIRYYQQMARVHFTVRAIERAHDGDVRVGACLDLMVARTRRPAARNGQLTAGRAGP